MSQKWLLELPELARSEAIRKMKLADILKLANISPEYAQIVKSAKIPLDSLQWKVSADEKMIVLERKMENLKEEQVVFRDIDFELPEENLRVLVAKVPCQIHESPEVSTWCITSGRENVKDLEMLSEHFLSLFEVENFDLTIGTPNSTNLKDFFAWKFTKTIRLLDVKGELEIEDVQWVLEDVDSEYLHLNNQKTSNQSSKGSYKRGLRTSRLLMVNPDFLHFDAILNSKSCQLSFDDYHPSAANINELLRSWINGGMDRMEVFSCFWETPQLNARYEKRALEFLEYKVWNEELESVVLRLSDSDRGTYVLSKGREIVRQDGKKRGIVLFDTTFGASSFRFYAFRPDQITEVRKGDEEDLEGVMQRLLY